MLPWTRVGSHVNLPSFPATRPETPTMRRAKFPRRLIVIVTFDGAQLLDIAGPLETFSLANRFWNQIHPHVRITESPYRIVVASLTGGIVRTNSGLPLETRSVRAVERMDGAVDTLIVSGGSGVHEAVRNRALVAWVARQAARVRRTCSVCSGAFVLAAAGVLRGRRATTHWKHCARLQQQYPQVRVETDPIHVNDGTVWTSAGVTAGIDMALALVEEDLGHWTAMQVARDLVVFLKRPGGQSQYSVPLALQGVRDHRFSALHAWMAANLEQDLRVERLAAQAHMSPRTFARAYGAAVGRTPAKMVEALRLEAARRALEETKASVKQVAAESGFASEQRLRRAFLREYGVGPLDFRKRFSPKNGGVGSGGHPTARPSFHRLQRRVAAR